jgi:hypothetical protein
MNCQGKENDEKKIFIAVYLSDYDFGAGLY